LISDDYTTFSLCSYQPLIPIDTMAQALKKKGNEFFVEGDYLSAEDYYSQA
jgi:hypothetical protein